MSDFELRRQELERRRDFLNALSQRPMSSGQMIGGIYVPASPMEGITKLVTSWMAGRANKEFEGKASAIEKERQADLMTQLEGFDTSTDPQAAARQALISAHPEMRQLGQIMLQRRLAPEKKQERWRVLSQEEKQQQGLPLDDAYQMNLDTNEVKKLDNATKVINQMPNPENRGKIKILEDAAEDFKLLRQAANESQRVDSIMAQLEEYDKAGVFSGPTANIATTLTAFADTIGIPLSDELKAQLTNSEGARQQVTQQIANVLLNSSVGRSLTDPDRKQLEASFPSLLSTPEGRRAIIQKFRAASAANRASYEDMQQTFIEQYPDLERIIKMPLRRTESIVPAVQPQGQSKQLIDGVVVEWGQ